jgi:plasmid stabilization system protein ParE
MPQGDKSAYTNKQKRKAEHIEEGYKKKGVSSKTAARRAWATVNKEDGGGKKSGTGRGKARKSTRKTARKSASKSTRRTVAKTARKTRKTAKKAKKR